MWYNPEIILVKPLTEVDILWAIYQQITAFTTLFFAAIILLALWKFLAWFLPKFWSTKNV